MRTNVKDDNDDDDGGGGDADRGISDSPFSACPICTVVGHREKEKERETVRESKTDYPSRFYFLQPLSFSDPHGDNHSVR